MFVGSTHSASKKQKGKGNIQRQAAGAENANDVTCADNSLSPTTHLTNQRRMNVLHAFASAPGALDLCVSSPTLQHAYIEEDAEDVIYSLGATVTEGQNNPKTGGGSRTPFTIYQGHHGGDGVEQFNVILPSTTYVEKKGTYVNTEGRVQQCQAALPAGSHIQHD